MTRNSQNAGSDVWRLRADASVVPLDPLDAAISERSGRQVKGLRLSHADAVNAAEVGEEFDHDDQGRRRQARKHRAQTGHQGHHRRPQSARPSRLRQHAGLSRLDPALSHRRGLSRPASGQYFYGRRGTPTSEALEKAIQEIEGPACAGVALLPSGLAAISTALLSVLQVRRPRAGDRQRLRPDPKILRHRAQALRRDDDATTIR